ncbi:MAG: ABC transporter transmembrane domain-containing protein, partial [Lancefieldella rimae]
MSDEKHNKTEAADTLGVATSVPDEELEIPADAAKTARRLWKAAAGNRWRLITAAFSALAYVFFTLAAPAYSAKLVDILWKNIQAAWDLGTTYQVTFETGGREILIFLSIWTLAWAFYTAQSLVMTSFAERLNLVLRKQIAEKIGRLPLSYFDAHRPGDTI